MTAIITAMWSSLTSINHLPVRVECYDWPTCANAEGELIEVYNYTNIQLNANLPDPAFAH